MSKSHVWRRRAGCPLPAREPSAKGASRLPLVFRHLRYLFWQLGNGSDRRFIPNTTLNATISASPRAVLALFWGASLLSPAQYLRPPCPVCRPGTAALLTHDCPTRSIMNITRCCGAAWPSPHGTLKFSCGALRRTSWLWPGAGLDPPAQRSETWRFSILTIVFKLN